VSIFNYAWDGDNMTRLAWGLLAGKSVSELRINTDQMDTDARRQFSHYLDKDSTLDCLCIDCVDTKRNDDWILGPPILGALSTKASLSKLQLYGDVLNDQRHELVAQLLVRNKWLKHLSIYSLASDGWMRSLENGLRHNTSLISLTLGDVDNECWLQTDMSPLKEVLTIPKTVDGIDDNGLHLKELYLNYKTRPCATNDEWPPPYLQGEQLDALADILKSEHCRLQVLKFNARCTDLTSIADALPKIQKVTHVAVNMYQWDEYCRDQERFKKKILGGIKANPILELAHFNELQVDDPNFEAEIKSHCMLNRARKVAASLQEGKLPLDILPNVLHSFASQNQYNPAEYHRYWAPVLSACKFTSLSDASKTESKPEPVQQSLGRKRCHSST
jgi:hypothetical protein